MTNLSLNRRGFLGAFSSAAVLTSAPLGWAVDPKAEHGMRRLAAEHRSTIDADPSSKSLSVGGDADAGGKAGGVYSPVTRRASASVGAAMR